MASDKARERERRYLIETEAQRKTDDEERRADYKNGIIAYPLDHDRLNGACLSLPACGCNITGRGTVRFPIRIEFCEQHRRP
jgi:hypothetical protein